MLHFEGTSRVTAAFLYTFFMSIGAGLAFDGRCQQHADRIVPAFTDWPFGVNCNHLKDIWKSGTESRKDDDFKCLITHNGQNRSEGIFELSNLTDNTIYEVKLVINRVNCIEGNVVIKLERFPETCQEAGRRFLRFKNSTVGNRVVLDCTTFEDGPMVIPEGANRDSFTTKWITGFDPGSKNRSVRAWANKNPLNETYGMSLKMGYIDCYDRTNFTCTVKHKNKTLHAVTYSLFVQEVSDISPGVLCAKNQAGFNCTSPMTVGETQPENIHIEWKRDGVTLCKNRVFEKNVTVDARFRCIAIDRSKNTSFEYMCKGDRKNTSLQNEKKIDLLFYIRDIEKGDYDSNYTIVFGVRNSNGIWQYSTEDLFLVYNVWSDSDVIIPVIVIGSLVAFVFAMIVLGFLLHRWHVYFPSWCTDVFKNNEKDNKNYVAYLSYYLNDGVESEEMEATEKIVTTIRKMMNGLQRLYYDEHTRGVSEDIYSVLSNCHRVVIVLTKDYLDEKRNESEAKTLLGLLNSKLSLIFVSTPGVEKYLKGAKNDVLLQAVFMAMINKNNSDIKWKPDMSEEIFKCHIEHALPKLPKRNAKSSFPSYGGIKMESIASQTTASTSTNFTDAQI